MGYKVKDYCDLLRNIDSNEDGPGKRDLNILESFADFLRKRKDERYKLVSAFYRIVKAGEKSTYKQYQAWRDQDKRIKKLLPEFPARLKPFSSVKWILGFPLHITFPAEFGLDKIKRLLSFSSVSICVSIKMEGELGELFIPEWLNDIEYIGELDASGLDIESVSDSLTLSTSIAKLNISNNKIKQLPDAIGNIKNLVSLEVSGNKLKAIPESISEIKSLQHLYVNKNKLTCFPECVCKTRSLKSLGISGNKLKEISSEIKKLTKLSWLDLSANNISRVPSELGELVKLKDLNLDNNAFTKIPITFWKLINLERLDISRNGITELTNKISSLQKLRHLSISGTSISRLPKTILQLSRLAVLEIKRTSIASIPGFPEQFPKLKLAGNFAQAKPKPVKKKAKKKVSKKKAARKTAAGKKTARKKIFPTKRQLLACIKRLAKADPKQFQPLGDYVHMGVEAYCETYPGPDGKKGVYDPYYLTDDQIKDEKKLLYGSMEIVAKLYCSSESWAWDRNLDNNVGDKFSEMYEAASDLISEYFGKPVETGTEMAKKKRKSVYITAGDSFRYSVWSAKGHGKEFYLNWSSTAGDGDFINILWISCIADNNYDQSHYKKKWKWER